MRYYEKDFPNYYLYKWKELGTRQVPVEDIVGTSDCSEGRFDNDFEIKNPNEMRYKRLDDIIIEKGIENAKKTIESFGMIYLMTIYSREENKWLYYVDTDGNRRTSLAKKYGVKKIKAEVLKYYNRLRQKDMVLIVVDLVKNYKNHDLEEIRKKIKIIEEHKDLIINQEYTRKLNNLYLKFMEEREYVNKYIDPTSSLWKIMEKYNYETYIFMIFFHFKVITEEDFIKYYNNLTEVNTDIKKSLGLIS
jgi:hypothetical protein